MNIDLTQAPATRGFETLSLQFPAPISLDNGIPLWVAGEGEEEICTLSVIVEGGTMYEPKAPLCSLLAGALIEGNARMSAKEIADQLDYYGAMLATQAYDYNLVTTLYCLTDNLEHVLPIVLDTLDSATFEPEQFATVVRRQQAQCAMALQRVKYLASQEMKRLYFGSNHPLARSPQPADFEQITREQLIKHRQRYYNVENCRLVAAGHVGEREIGLINSTFGQWQHHGERAEEPEWRLKPEPQRSSFIAKDDAVQSAITIVMPGVDRHHADYFNLRILTTVLGGYFGSRLMSNIREDKGYTYGIGASLYGRRHDSMIGISTECDSQYTEPVINEIHHEIERLKQEPIGADELATVKQFMLSEQAKTLDTPYSIASAIRNQWLFGTYPDYFNRQVEAILNVDANQLLATAQRYFNLDEAFQVIAGKNINN